MGRYNELLTGRYNRFVQKLFSMKGPASLVTVADELRPIFPFFNGAENRYLEGWDRFGAGTTVAAGGAGTFAGVRIRNPSGSNLMIVLESAVAHNTVGLADQPILQRATGNNDLATVGNLTNSRIDARGRSGPTAVISSAATAVVPLPNSLDQRPVPANGYSEFILYEDQQIPILPGDVIQLTCNVANQQFNGNFRWRERFLEDSERA